MVRYALSGDLLGELSRNWWVVVLRGAAAILFGLVALIWPGVTLVVLALVFGVYALVDGAVLGYAAYRAAPGNRTTLVVQAVLGALMGLVALLWPFAAIVALVFVIGAWAVITGVAEIVTAIRLRAHISSEWLLVFVGSLSVVFGLLLWFWPLEGARSIMFVIAVYAIIFGVVLAVAGFRLRGAANALAQTGGAVSGDESTEEAGRGLSSSDGGRPGGYRGDEPLAQGPGGAPDDADAIRPPRSGGRHRAPESGPDRPDERG